MENIDPAALTFTVAYGVLILYGSILFLYVILSRKLEERAERLGTCYEYGTCNGRTARRHKRYKYVQFIIWESDPNREKDHWVNFDSSHWHKFLKEIK